MPGHFFVSKFLKEIQIIAIVIFYVWTFHPQKVFYLLLFFTNFSLFFFTKFVLKKCIITLAVIAVQSLFIGSKKRVEAQKYPEIKQLLSIAETQTARRLKQLKLKLTPMQATLLAGEYETDRLNSSPRRKINHLKINRSGGTNY